MPKPKAMSDEDFAALARDYKLASNERDLAAAKAEECRDRMVAELDRRGRQSVEVDELIVTKKRRRIRKFDIDTLKQRLPRALRLNVIQERVDAKAVDALVKANMLETELVEVDGEKVPVVVGVETVEFSAPYIDVTVRKP